MGHLWVILMQHQFNLDLVIIMVILIMQLKHILIYFMNQVKLNHLLMKMLKVNYLKMKGGVNHHDTLSFLNNIEVQSIPIDKSNYYPTIDGKDEIFEMIGDNTDGDETDEVDDKTENKLVDQLAQVFKKDGYQNKEDSDDPLLNSRIKERAKEIINNITPDIPIDFPKPE